MSSMPSRHKNGVSAGHSRERACPSALAMSSRRMITLGEWGAMARAMTFAASETVLHWGEGIPSI